MLNLKQGQGKDQAHTRGLILEWEKSDMEKTTHLQTAGPGGCPAIIQRGDATHENSQTQPAAQKPQPGPFPTGP